MIRWLERKFFAVFPDDQFATMVAHTLLTLLPAAGAGAAVRTELGIALEAELPEGADMEGVKERIYQRWAVTLGRFAAGDA